MSENMVAHDDRMSENMVARNDKNRTIIAKLLYPRHT